MNIRLITVVAAVTLVTTTSGCCGLKNFMFGRGARCGLCQRLGSPLATQTPAPAYAPQTPCQSAPCQSAPYQAAPYQAAPYAPAAPAVPYAPAAPTCSPPMVSMPQASCGCNGYVDGGSATYGSAYGGDCQCQSYGGVVSDPYLSSGTVVPYGEQIIGEQILGEQIVGDQVIGGTSYPNGSAPIQSEWQARKFDTDGNKILWEEPLPPGATPQQ